jgi:DNA (cytosine-5)-methyltransferase 1
MNRDLCLDNSLGNLMSKKRPIGIDLFAGAGGMSLGFEQAGFDIKASVEIDPVHSAVHKFNFPNCETICESVVNLTGKQILKRAKIDEPVDVVFGGAPCQGFSMIGYRVLQDPRNSLVFHYLRLVSEIKPKSFVFENVKGLTVGDHKKLLEEFIEEANKIGYKVIEPYRVLNSADYGVPQDRQRLFIIGVRKGIPLPQYPEPTVQRVGKKNLKVLPLLNLPQGPTVWDAIGDIPDLDSFEALKESDKVKAKLKKATPYSTLLRDEETDKTNFGYLREWDSSFLTSSMRTNHTDESIRRYEEASHGSAEPISRLFKLDPKGICNTLRAGTDSQRGAHTSPRPLHPFIGRVISVREAGRLHSYPDWFRFHITKWHGFRQIGNSVPPMLARAVGSEVIKALGYKPTKPKEKIKLGDEELLGFNMSEASAYFGVSKTVIPQRNRKYADSGRQAEV